MMYKKIFFQTLFISISFILIHAGINSFSNIISLQDIILVHTILFALTFGGCALLIATSTFDPNKLGFAFLAVSTIKLLVSASLILILVKGFDKPKAIGVHFAAVYFLYIIFLSVFTLRLLSKK